MSSAAETEAGRPEYVTLNFRVHFLKSEVVKAPDNSPHPLTIKCIKPDFLGYPTVEIGPLNAVARHHSEHHKHALLVKASEDRALLAAAVALFDAEFARVLAGHAAPPPPP